MKILDMSAGHRGIWFNRTHPSTTYVDVRPEVAPDVVCDSRKLADGIVGDGYGLIVFDPPHVNFGAKANMSQHYGHHTTEEIRDIIEGSSKAASAVSIPGALMAFKWNDHDQKLSNVLKLMRPWWEPLFGTTVALNSKRRSATYWVMLEKVTA